MYLRLIYTTVFFLLLVVGVSAQSNNEIANYKTLIYKHDVSGSLLLHSNGWGINGRKGWHVTGKKRKVVEADIVGMKHPKEVKTVNPRFDNAKGYVYGKLNSFSVIRAGYGYRNTLFGKADRGGVEVRYHYFGGVSLGITKPVYLDILVPVSPPSSIEQEYKIKTEKYDPDEHFASDIYGKAAFTEGLSEVGFHPGGYFKTGVSFEFSAQDDKIRALETGLVVDVYPSKIPIMAFTENKQLFFSFYLSLVYGKRWI